MEYQNKNLEYTNAKAYDKRGESSILEKYVLNLWQPFLKKKIADLSGDKVIADLGCGTGEYLLAAEEAKKIYAVDVSELMLKICRKKLKNFQQAEIIQSSIQNFNIAEPVDLILTIGIWEYISPQDLLSTIKKIARRGSKIVIVFPNIYNDLNLVRSIFKTRSVALRPGFVKKLFKAEFELLESASFGMVSWFPKKLQILAFPVWKFCDFIWAPFQKFLPLGVNVYYLFERK